MTTLAIYAHPDDEILWGFPQLQYGDIEKHLLTISDNHPGYDYHAKEALKKVCKRSGINLIDCLDLPSEFYRVATRRKPFTLMQDVVPTIRKAIINAIEFCKPDKIITHNPFGEYGHGDHRLIFNIVSGLPEQYDKIQILFTDACQLNKCHLSFDSIPPRLRDAWFANPIERYQLDKRWFEPLKQIYRNYDAWSWTGHEVEHNVTLYGI